MFHTNENQGNTAQNDVMLCADNQRVCFLGYKIPELVKNEKIKTRKFSYDSQMYLLMLGQSLHILLPRSKAAFMNFVFFTAPGS